MDLDPTQMSDTDIRKELQALLPADTPKSFLDLWVYWYSIRYGKVLPDVADFDPMRITRLLPDISVFERRKPDELIYRLAGTAIAERMGHDPTGENLVDLTDPARHAFVTDLFTGIIETPAGAFVRYENTYASGRKAMVQSFFLPMVGPKKEGGEGEPSQGFLQRILSIHHMEAAKEYESERQRTTVGSDIDKTVWIDIGQGVPKNG